MKLPIISSVKAIKALEKIGFEIDHQKGSHIVLKKTSSPFTRVVIPKRKELPKGTLRAIIRQIGLNKKEFTKLLGK